MKKICTVFCFVLYLLIFYCCVVYRSEISSGVKFAIDYSLQTLIPSLFPMIFLSCLVSNSSAKDILSFLFSPFCTHVLRLPKCCSCAILFGLFAGYPVGAKLVSNLLNEKKITDKEASRLLLFCVNPGLSFSMIFVGGVIFKSVKLGFFIFLSTVIASLLLGFIFSTGNKKPVESLIKPESRKFVDILSKSASQSLSSTMIMCLYIMIFSAFLPLINVEMNGFYFLFEVTHAVVNSTVLDINIFVLGLAFGGLCVHLQIFSLFKSGVINYKKFYLSRVLHSVFSLAIFKILMQFFPVEQNVFSTMSEYITKSNQGTYLASLSLIMLSCTFIYMNKNIEKEL